MSATKLSVKSMPRLLLQTKLAELTKELHTLHIERLKLKARLFKEG
jgi:hypothetical protein